MAESFLKEQLERIRKLTERMSALQSHAAELSDVMAHDRELLRQNPLHEIRDYRSCSVPDYEPKPRSSVVAPTIRLAS